MTIPRPVARRLLDDGGRITWVTMALLVGLAGGAYLAWVWVPVYVLQYEVKQVVRDYGNQAVKNPDDAKLVADLVHKIATLDSEWSTDDAGRPVQVPVIDLRPQDVVWERSQNPPALHVAFAYTQVVRLPFLDRTVEKVMPVDLTMDISLPDWGPAR